MIFHISGITSIFYFIFSLSFLLHNLLLLNFSHIDLQLKQRISPSDPLSPVLNPALNEAQYYNGLSVSYSRPIHYGESPYSSQSSQIQSQTVPPPLPKRLPPQTGPPPLPSRLPTQNGTPHFPAKRSPQNGAPAFAVITQNSLPYHFYDPSITSQQYQR